jgi:hypothetical protein
MLRSTPAQTPSRSVECSRCHRVLGLGDDHLILRESSQRVVACIHCGGTARHVLHGFHGGAGGVSFLMTLWSSYRQKTDPDIGPLGQVRPPLLNTPRLGRAPPVARQSTARWWAIEQPGRAPETSWPGIAGVRLPVHSHPHRDFARTHLGLAHGKAEAWFTDHRVTVVRLRLMLDTPSGLASSCPTDAMGGQCTRDCSRARQRRGFQVTVTTQEENAMIRTQPAGNTDAPRSAATSAPLFSRSAGPLAIATGTLLTVGQAIWWPFDQRKLCRPVASREPVSAGSQQRSVHSVRPRRDLELPALRCWLGLVRRRESTSTGDSRVDLHLHRDRRHRWLPSLALPLGHSPWYCHRDTWWMDAARSFRGHHRFKRWSS